VSPRIPKTPPKKAQISVRGSTYLRLRRAAQDAGEQVRTYTDALINDWLDKRPKPEDS
jgi:hypothetical protein